MKKFFWLSFAFVILTLSAPAEAVEIKSGFSGHWVDKQYQATIIIFENNDVLRVMGKDPASMFTMTCVTNANQATCAGEGAQTEDDVMFVYSSKYVLQKDGVLKEQWTAHFHGGKEVSGSGSFVRKKD